MRVLALFAVFGCINGCPGTCCSSKPPAQTVNAPPAPAVEK